MQTTWAEGDYVTVYGGDQLWEVLQVMRVADSLYVAQRTPGGQLRRTMLVPMDVCEKDNG